MSGGVSLAIETGGIAFRNPILTASGTFGYGREFEQLTDLGAIGGLVTKGISPAPRFGNATPRICETASGMLNSIGLPNKGLEGYLREDLPRLAELPVPLITNVMGSTAEELAELVEAVGRRDEVAALELNVSCPNVKTGLDIGAVPAELERVVRAVRPRADKPIIVKLTPNTADVAACARAAESGGADAVSLINTLRGMALDPRGDRPWLGGGTGGLSGPAVRAVALAQVASVAAAISIPIVGMGGVATGNHARDLLRAGATLVAVGTESFRDPAAGLRVSRELGLLENPCKTRQHRQPA